MVTAAVKSEDDCFLTCRQVTQETGKMIWYSPLFRSISKSVMIHTVKNFSIVNWTEVNAFFNFPCFLYNQVNVGNLISGFSAFYKPNLNIWHFSVHIMLKLSLKDLSITLLVWEMSATVQGFEHCLVLPFLEIRIRADLFQSCGHCWVFKICWHI